MASKKKEKGSNVAVETIFLSFYQRLNKPEWLYIFQLFVVAVSAASLLITRIIEKRNHPVSLLFRFLRELPFIQRDGCHIGIGIFTKFEKATWYLTYDLILYKIFITIAMHYHVFVVVTIFIIIVLSTSSPN